MVGFPASYVSLLETRGYRYFFVFLNYFSKHVFYNCKFQSYMLGHEHPLKRNNAMCLLLHTGEPLNPWSWGDPFEDAEGRPETKHSHLDRNFIWVLGGSW